MFIHQNSSANSGCGEDNMEALFTNSALYAANLYCGSFFGGAINGTVRPSQVLAFPTLLGTWQLTVAGKEMSPMS